MAIYHAFGISAEQWAVAKREAKGLMISRARVRGMISYSDLVAGIKAFKFDAHDQRLNALLDEISKEEDAAGRGMLTVVVVHRIGDMQPGPGFFELAKSLGRDTSDILKCWVDELHRVHALWERTTGA